MFAAGVGLIKSLFSLEEGAGQTRLFELLCQICSRRASRESLESLTGDEWEALWSQSLRHKIGPVVANSLQEQGIELHPSIAAEVAGHNRQNLLKAMRHTAELVRLTRLFDSNGIRFLAFKGLALLGLMELDLTQRHCGDMDLLLIDPNDLAKADELLTNAGFQQVLGMDRTRLKNQRMVEFFPAKDISYENRNLNIQIELHLSLFHVELLSLTPEDLYSGRSEIKIGSENIPVINLDSHLIYLLLHGSFSCWHRLKWLVDIPLVGRDGEKYLTADFKARIIEYGVEKSAYHALALSHRLLGMRVDDEVKEVLLSSKMEKWHQSMAIKVLSKGVVFQAYRLLARIRRKFTEDGIYRLSMCDSFSSKMACVRPL